jgi:hypothetical protein
MPAAKGTRPPNAGKGRPKGVPNKFTGTVKSAFEAVFKDLQADPKQPYALGQWAKTEPQEFYKLAAKLIPQDIKASVSGSLVVTPNINLIVDKMADGRLTMETDPVGVDGTRACLETGPVMPLQPE